ncbi:hypothetical protein HK44_027410 [Pseudomonas fluorescens HK44]|uniref:Uncharacterized protein n=1 Tax=Pseudomonas fluorescens HK44 TaxID=1042209 RepID=A0A010S2H1_PSEFL|nr:hypothetical protein HK44_027410 [Pseudomonas fluorescens HK44]
MQNSTQAANAWRRLFLLFLASRCFVRDAKWMKEGLLTVVEPGIAVATA